MSQDAFEARCPSCDMLVDTVGGAKFLPFCSERCRLIDLGRWLNEEHAVSCEADETMDAEASSTTELPPGWHDA